VGVAIGEVLAGRERRLDDDRIEVWSATACDTKWRRENGEIVASGKIPSSPRSPTGVAAMAPKVGPSIVKGFG